MAKQASTPHPFGGWFGTLGGFAGFGYGAYLTDGAWGPALFLAVIGAAVGIIVEHIVARVLIVGLFFLGFVIREEIISALFS